VFAARPIPDWLCCLYRTKATNLPLKYAENQKQADARSLLSLPLFVAAI
jgi:hypothetical protein